jgi:uncharacterized protein YciI
MTTPPSTRSQYLYVLRPARPAMLTDGPTEAERAAVGEHFSYLTQLAQRGDVVLFGRTTNSDADTIGLVIFEAADDSAAKDLMNNDPAVAAGVMTAQLFPYRIAGMRQP